MRALVEAVRAACVEAAQAGYEDASIRGLCGEGAWEAAIGAIRTVALDALVERAEPPAAGPALELAAGCAELATLAAGLAGDGSAAARRDAAAALALAESAADCALALADEALRAARPIAAASARRRIDELRQRLRRARAAHRRSGGG